MCDAFRDSLRYFSSLSDARLAARYASIRDDDTYHIDRTDSGCFYLSTHFTSQTILTYSYGIETRVEHIRAA